jgi:COMPASS component SWD3
MERLCDFKTTGTVGHTNRIFSVKFDQNSPNLIYSGGWDCMVNIWDLRTGRCSGTIFGPQICGEAIDIKDDSITLLTGSHKIKDGL